MDLAGEGVRIVEYLFPVLGAFGRERARLFFAIDGETGQDTLGRVQRACA